MNSLCVPGATDENLNFLLFWTVNLSFIVMDPKFAHPEIKGASEVIMLFLCV